MPTLAAVSRPNGALHSDTSAPVARRPSALVATLGVDTDAARVDQLNAGHLPIYEPGLEELLRAGLGAGRVRFTTSYPEAAAFGDVHFICTGTPQQPGSDRADLSQVHSCVAALAP